MYEIYKIGITVLFFIAAGICLVNNIKKKK